MMSSILKKLGLFVLIVAMAFTCDKYAPALQAGAASVMDNLI